MRNFKHSVIAAIAIAMISSLAAAQAADFKSRTVEKEHRINAAAAENTITIAEKDLTDAVKGTAEIVLEDENDNDAESTDDTAVSAEEYENWATESEIAAKSYLPIAYIVSYESTAKVMETPSEEAEILDEPFVGTEVYVTESSEGWYKISYDGGKTGYIAKDYVTQDRAAANDAKMSISNYKIGQVSLAGNSVRVRSEASTDGNVLDELEDGRYVYILGSEDDFLKVCYGSDYSEGYIINTSVELTGEWESKDTIAEKQQEIREAREAAARAEEIARQNAAKAGVSQQQAEEIMSAGSGKGQDIVNTAMQYLGTPYVWGGTSPSGFDCSGLVQYVCSKNGISIARVASDQRNCGTYVSRENLQPGDLVFFAKGGYIHHVGIYVGNGNMIHAPQTGDVVKISSINTEYRIAQYAGAVRMY